MQKCEHWAVYHESTNTLYKTKRDRCTKQMMICTYTVPMQYQKGLNGFMRLRQVSRQVWINLQSWGRHK